MKQLIPTEIDEYIAEHKIGDTVSGRVIEQSPSLIHVELGDGIRAVCRIRMSGAAAAPSAPAPAPAASPKSKAKAKAEAKPDLSSLSSMLKDRWKGNTPSAQAKPQAFSEGQIRSFKITKLDADSKKIEVELA